MTYMAERVSNFGTTIFFEMTALANQHRAVNLGQGFPGESLQEFQVPLEQFGQPGGDRFAARAEDTRR